jgi:hypothetical protein
MQNTTIITTTKSVDEKQPNFDQEIAELVDLVRGMQERIGGMQEKIQMAKERLRDLLEQSGGSWKDSEGYARLTSDSVRASYDSKALDQLILSDPLRNGWLKDYRKESVVRGTIQVK